VKGPTEFGQGIAKACLDEGLLSLCRPHSRLYGESIQMQRIPVTNDSAPSYIQGTASLFKGVVGGAFGMVGASTGVVSRTLDAIAVRGRRVRRESAEW
jgi:hypothetical protein